MPVLQPLELDECCAPLKPGGQVLLVGPDADNLRAREETL